MGNLLKILLGFGLGVGILKAVGGGGGEAGSVVQTGKATGITDGLEYQWRIIRSEEGAEFPFAAQARTAGTEGWTVEQIVAWGPTSGEAKANLMEWLSKHT